MVRCSAAIMPEIAEQAAALSHPLDPITTAQAVVAGSATGRLNDQGFRGPSQFMWSATLCANLPGVSLEVAGWTH